MSGTPDPAEAQERWELLRLGMATEALVHELGNDLYRVLMQVAILSKQVPEELRPGVEVVREEARNAANRLRPLQAARAARRDVSAPVDVAALVAEVCPQWPEAEIPEPLAAVSLPVRRLPFVTLLESLRGVAAHLAAISGGRFRVRLASDLAAATLSLGAGTPPGEAEGVMPELGEGAFEGVAPMDLILLSGLLRSTRGRLFLLDRGRQGFRLECRWALDGTG